MAGIVGGMFGLVYNQQKDFNSDQQPYNQKISEIYGFIELLKDKTNFNLLINN